VGVNTVTATVTFASGLSTWSLTAVYGPQQDQAKLQFLGELRWLQHSVCDSWLIVGDFNMILTAADKSNPILNRRLMGAFREVVRDLSLKELNLRGRKFTWSNDHTQTRIDRAFCTTPWDLMFPDVQLQALCSRVSDHCPLLIARCATGRQYRGFRFESFWPRLQGFAECVQEAWSKPVQATNPFLRLHIKLQRTSTKLRQWARGLLGNNKVLLCAAQKMIAILDVVEDFRPLSQSEILLRMHLKVRFLGLIVVEKMRAKQRSRLSMIRASEATEKLFYLYANGRRRKNTIHCLETNDGVFFHIWKMRQYFITISVHISASRVKENLR
jgi:hypothetical protein